MNAVTSPGQVFVSQAIHPLTETGDTRAMVTGSPALPREFIWRNERLCITRVLRSWRETGPCKHGSAEKYVRKHWFEVETSTGQQAKLYFERQPRGGGRGKRWWLFSITETSRSNTT